MRRSTDNVLDRPVKATKPVHRKKTQAITTGERCALDIRAVLDSKYTARIYATIAFLVLLGTTVVWAYMGAHIHQSNADQLVDAYLFQDGATFHGATFPGQHTFLVKWPLFWLISVFGSSPAAFTWATVGVVLASVFVLAALLYRIERRPLYLGTIYLALASILLVIPAQPYPGGILPVNMAMVTTRNIEYALYMLSLAMLARWPQKRNWRFWSALRLLGLLVASDKLFLALSASGALVACVVYVLQRRWKLAMLMVHWFIWSILAGVLAAGILMATSAFGWTHIGGGSELSPYGVTNTANGMTVGVVYAVLGLLTNLGANPVGDVRVFRTMPQQAVHAYASWNGIALVVHAALALLGIWAVVRLLLWSLRRQSHETKLGDAAHFALMMVWSSLAACGIFVVSNHYFQVDARYLEISLFGVVIAGAVALRTVAVRPRILLVAAVVLCISIASGLVTATRTYHREQAAMDVMTQRNSAVAQAIKYHPVDALVGDYWRVLPIKLAAKNPLNVTPLADCTTPRQILTSNVWQPNLDKTRFAYLLSLDANLTGSPSCNLDQVLAAYGKPNSSIVVAGTPTAPTELLLFYDRGAHHSAPLSTGQRQSTATVTPISPDLLPSTICQGPTVMNIVAHQDDDLLFMNPGLMQDIKAGNCVRTVYVTAGDAGADDFYWLSRQAGAEAAYSTMLGTNVIWVERIVELADNSFVSIANPKGNTNVSLIFMHLPDGNIKGTGFSTLHYESLARLRANRIPIIHSVDGYSNYTAAQLVDALSQLMRIYQPTQIRTQGSPPSKTNPDHSDHIMVGEFATQAYRQYESIHFDNTVTIPLKYFTGYPTARMPENVSGDDLERKSQIFFSYGEHDSRVCHSEKACDSSPNAYHLYLRRQYFTNN
jgi:LmbE family N-acetylglucosaminyl deacetylase